LLGKNVLIFAFVLWRYGATRRPCKWDETMEEGYRSPKKQDQRTFGGKRVTSTGLAGALKRHANNAVHWKREIILLEAQIADLPRNNPHHGGGGKAKNPLLGQLTKARAELDGWTDKLHMVLSESLTSTKR
jgi:hypothetical protein